MPKKTTKNTAAKSTKKVDVAKQFEALEKIVASFEEDDLDLNTSLDEFEKGLKLAEELKATLKDVENTIESLKKQYQVDEE